MSMTRPTTHPTHIEAVADAAASGSKGDVVNALEKELWPRINAAIFATTVSRAAIEYNWPECHKTRCNHRHPNPDEAFRLFAERVAEAVQSELLCRSTTEPDMEDGAV